MVTVNYGSLELVAASDHVTDWQEGFEAAPQIHHPMRGKTAQVIRRGGALTRISFTASREHASFAAAIARIRSVRLSLIQAATANAVIALDGGASYTLLNAAVEVISSRAYGVTSYISFTITGAEDIPTP